MAERNKKLSWRSLGLCALATLATVVGVDALLQRRVPIIHLREVEDALDDLAAGDPTVLVLGSSHGRTFVALGEELARRTDRAERLVAVPVEWGKLSSYEWVVDHRLLPLLDERSSDGAALRPSLRRFVLVTEWWDSCAPEDGLPPNNLPARAWLARHFVADVTTHGLTAYNRNYLNTRWLRAGWRSILVQDRGHERIMATFKASLRPPSPESVAARFDLQTANWQRMIEDGAQCIADPDQMAAQLRILETFRRRGVELTIVLYPRKPGTLTAKAKATTLARYSVIMKRMASERGIRLLDLTTDSPLLDEDYAADFDHVTPAGNRKFAAWALDGPMSFLLRPATPGTGGGMQP